MSKTHPGAAARPDGDGRHRNLRRLPSVEKLLQRPGVAALSEIFGRAALVEAVRSLVAELRERAASGISDASFDEALASLEADIRRRLEEELAPSLAVVVNATGIIVHTNLGRAPLATRALEAVGRVAAGYSNLELDLETGRRGSRHQHAQLLLARLLPGYRALVVNNAAAAVMLSLNTFARGKEVVISRGELVEIGGSFRVPEILERSGARLREVGTTNKTRLADYERAIGPETGALLRVHPSNFRIVGFTERASTEELVGLGEERGLPVIEDFGSGNLISLAPYGLPNEPTVGDSLASGVDLTIFSGDKLLGGPQAGLAVGKADAIDALKRNPMARAVRVDKLTYAALEATLASFVEEKAVDEVPVLRMLTASQEEIGRRAAGLVERLSDTRDLELVVEDSTSRVGGGAAADAELPTSVVSVSVMGASAEQALAKLRRHRPPVIARIAGDRVLLDLRTVAPSEESIIEQALRSLAASE